MEDKETLEEIKAELEETRDILKDRIITKINKREELLDDLDDIANGLHAHAKEFQEVTRDIEHKEEVRASCFPSLRSAWIDMRSWCRQKWTRCTKGPPPTPPPPEPVDIDAMVASYKSQSEETAQTNAE